MIEHLSLGIRDIDISKAFYDALLEPLGIARLYDGIDFAAYGANGSDDFSIHEGGSSWCPDSKVHIAFRAPSREAVEAFYEAGLRSGGKDDGSPGLRPQYADDYFAAFIRDPDGQRIEAVFRATPT